MANCIHLECQGLHLAIGRWLIGQPRELTGAEFRFLRTEMDLSQRLLGQLLGVTDQAIAKWEKARQRPVANKSAERLLRVDYSNSIGGSGSLPRFSTGSPSSTLKWPK